jgi:hypothetical protein
MRTSILIGLVLVVIGVLLLGYQGVAYFTTRETAARVGPIEVQTAREHPVPLGPILSGITIAGGIVILAIGAAKSRSHS